MVTITCPGETGTRSLLNTPHIINYYNKPEKDQPVESVEWSIEALEGFRGITASAIKGKPDVLFIDGVHSLYNHMMNRTTNGLFLSGGDLSINPRTGRYDPYQASKYYSQTHKAFGNFISYLYDSPVPLVVCTTWEAWQSGVQESDAGRSQGIEAKRYLWPAIAGSMALEVVGRFDGRVSARLETRCLYPDCEDNKNSNSHHVWQFLSKNDVMGVGIKGLKPTKSMKANPWIHQQWDQLEELIENYTE